MRWPPGWRSWRSQIGDQDRTARATRVQAWPLPHSCLGAIRVGVLAMHRERAGGLAPAELADSLAFAELALRLLLDAQAGNGTATEADLPLHSAQVHQATGMVAGQLEMSMEDAFARLRARAFADRRPLAELSADVVARVVRFDR